MLASGSWREGCPITIADLRVLELSYWDFAGAVAAGKLMVNADVADSVVEAFRSLFDAHVPVHRMELVDAFGADDEQSMLADNTSAYNCRGIPGSSAWSQHAYGRAVDINPFENPEVRAGNVDPPQAARFADRSLDEQGMIHSGDAAVQAFAAIGWHWAATGMNRRTISTSR
jgi:poly-gamma-glutamate synthesis protein (capsule biosynthesis protein)